MTMLDYSGLVLRNKKKLYFISLMNSSIKSNQLQLQEDGSKNYRLIPRGGEGWRGAFKKNITYRLVLVLRCRVLLLNLFS